MIAVRSRAVIVDVFSGGSRLAGLFGCLFCHQVTKSQLAWGYVVRPAGLEPATERL
jgi:hypothetical protein